MNLLRTWILVALVGLGQPLPAEAFVAASEAQEKELILVASQGDNLVTLYSAGDFQRQQVVRVEEGPSGLVMAKNKETLAVLHRGGVRGGHTVTFFSLRLGRVLRVVNLLDPVRPEAALYGPCAGAFSPDGTHLLLGVESDTYLHRMTVETGISQPLIDLGERGASQILVGPDGDFAWVSFAASGTLLVCDLARGRVVQRISLGGGTSNIALHPAGHELWATNALTNSISVVDLALQREVVEFSVGSQPWDLAFTPNGKSVLVIHRHGGSATLFDTKRRSVRGEIKLGQSQQFELGDSEGSKRIGVLPSAVSMGTNGSVAHVTCEGSGELLTLRLSPLSIEQRLPVGQRPAAVCVVGTGSLVP